MKTSVSLLIGAVGLVAFSTVACSPKKEPGQVVPITGGSTGVGGTSPTAGGATGVGGGSAAGGGTGAGGGALGATIAIDGVWVPESGNTVGIQGAFYILADKVKDGVALTDGFTHSVFTADTGAVNEDGIDKFGPDSVAPCVSGTAAQVMQADGVTACDASDSTAPCAWDLFWGGGIGLNLSETGEVDGTPSVQSPWNAVTAGVTGFKFGISGDVGGATIRVKATQDGNADDFCKTITVTPDNSVVEVSLSELEHNCWDTDGMPLDTTKLNALQWQIVTDDGGSHDVANFCINSLEWF